MKRFWQLLVLGYVAFAIPATVSAQILGLNFASTDPDIATSELLPTEAAGVISHTNWNNLIGATGTGSPRLARPAGIGRIVTRLGRERAIVVQVENQVPGPRDLLTD
jgi:hypothetical protein